MTEQLTNDYVRETLKASDGISVLMSELENGALECALALFMEEENSAALGFLARAAKRAAVRIELKSAPCFSQKLQEALTSPDFKARKNAARVMGAMCDPMYEDSLIQAMRVEGSRIVLPSIILALGAINTDSARAAISAHVVRPAESEREEKHVASEREAVRKALSRSQHDLKRHVFTGLKFPVEVKMVCAEGLGDALFGELIANGISPYAHDGQSAWVRTDDMAGLYTMRCADDILIGAAMHVPANPGELAKAALSGARTINLAHSTESPLRCRIAVYNSQENKRQLISDMIAHMGETFINSPSDYEIEVCVYLYGDFADVYYRLHTLADSRFSYRLNSVPASINPSVAAGMLRLAKPYLHPDARVLDPFCGSGTMLIERERLMPAMSLTGVDIAHRAIDVARENAQAAGSRAKFICNDCLRFQVRRPYDELIANMPFGNRVSNHRQNEELYAAFISRIRDWMRPGAFVLLYSMEFSLLKRLIASAPHLEFMKLEKTSAGGLMPGIFFCKVK